MLIIEHGLLAGLQANGLLHVRLAGAEPDFSHQKVGECSRVAGFDAEGLWRKGSLLFPELHQPLTVGSSTSSFALAGKSHSDLGPRCGPPPDWNGRLLLQHHVIAKDGGQLQPSAGGDLEGQDRPGQAKAKPN